jgi:flagellar biosynthesis protein FlhB
MAQLPTFTENATEFIMEVAKIMWFLMWSWLVLMMFYSGFLLLTDQWKSENMKKAKNIIVWVLLSALVVFILLLIMYQLFAEFGEIQVL